MSNQCHLDSEIGSWSWGQSSFFSSQHQSAWLTHFSLSHTIHHSDFCSAKSASNGSMIYFKRKKWCFFSVLLQLLRVLISDAISGRHVVATISLQIDLSLILCLHTPKEQNFWSCSLALVFALAEMGMASNTWLCLPQTSCLWLSQHNYSMMIAYHEPSD